jgi:Spy/CpxP family protein refolding chaperone
MTKFVVILGFLLSFAAGLVIGSRRGAVVPETPTSAASPAAATQPSSRDADKDRRSRSGFLSAELSLTPDQRNRLDEIWSSMAKDNDQDEQRRQFRRERDAAIADLVPAGRLGEYDRIIDAYHDRIEAMERTTREAYEAAVDQTKDILTPEQRTRYEELLKRHRWGSGAARDRSTTRRSETRATSQPGGIDPITSSHDLLKGASR